MMNSSKFLKRIFMLHLLRLINYERKKSSFNLREKWTNLRRASIVAMLAINFFKKNSTQFIGKSEKYAAKAIKGFCRKRGYRQGFPLLVGSGENTSNIHARPSKRIIKRDEIIMIDIGLKRASHYFSDYCSDMTRTFSFGKITKYQEKIYKIVQEAHDIALKEIKPGIRAYTLHNKIENFIETKGYKLPHGLGHSTRRYTHSIPFLSSYDLTSIIKENDHITIEPGIYVSEGNPNLPKDHKPFGVRIEDLIIVQKDGYISLTSETKLDSF